MPHKFHYKVWVWLRNPYKKNSAKPLQNFSLSNFAAGIETLLDLSRFKIFYLIEYKPWVSILLKLIYFSI